MRRLPAVAACLALSLAAFGCVGGGGDDQGDAEDAAAAASAYFEGLAEGDGERTCDQVTAEGQQELANAAEGVPGLSGECAEVIDQVGPQLPKEAVDRLRQTAAAIDAGDVEIQEGVATVQVHGSTTPIQLEQEDGSWRITGETLRSSIGTNAP
jgi:hypothetical protein